MKIKEVSANKLNKLSKRKPLICFGAGEMMLKLFVSLQDMGIDTRVKCIVDNDSKKWGSFIMIGDTNVQIIAPQELMNIDVTKYTIVITAMRYKEIFAQLQNLLVGAKISCYLLPKYRYGIAKLFLGITKHLPLKNYILMQGEGDTCENGIAIGKYIKEHNFFNKYRLIWLCNNTDKFTETDNEKYITRYLNLEKHSYRELWNYYYYTNCSRYLIFENIMISKSRSEQISVYMNHGAPPLKSTVGKIVLEKDVNYSLCPSENVADIVSTQFGINKERLLYCGSPRTDVFFVDEINKKIIDKLQMEKFSKVILWAPTFRQLSRANRVDSSAIYPYGVPILYTDDDYQELKKCLEKNNILLIIKPHLYQDMTKMNIDGCDNINILLQKDLDEINANVYDLLKLVDSLITDYSTIAFEYMMLDRPICYTIDDMDKYHIGFSVDNPLDFMPGTKVVDMEGFIQYFEEVSSGVDEFRDERRKLDEFIHPEKGNHCKKMLKALKMI